MDKDAITSKMDKYMKSILPNLKCEKDRDLTLVYCYEQGFTAVAWFECFDINRFQIGGTSGFDEAKELVEKNVIKAFYQKGVELLHKVYSIQVVKNSNQGYLNVRRYKEDTTFIISDKEQSKTYQTLFTLNEINELKQNKDLCINWDRVKIEEF